MTPAARVQAAIEILDRVVAGEPTEKALTQWARSHRFAGSKDRAAIRDHVFDAVRCKNSYANAGDGLNGRGLMLGGLCLGGSDVATLFDGSTYGPDPLTAEETAFITPAISDDITVDLQDWIWEKFQADLGDQALPTANALRERASVFLRVNTRKGDLASAQSALVAEDIETVPSALSPTALRVTTNPRRVATSKAFQDGLVELQDAASQAVCDFVSLDGAQTVLDYCAGGGGKTLALAARSSAKFVAHDADFNRMGDLPQRAKRAGVNVQLRKSIDDSERFDVVLCDVPCSGSGSWRRSPDGKWALTPQRLAELTEIQREILRKTAPLVASGGVLAYATCSVFASENNEQIESFLAANPDWKLENSHQFLPQAGGDGFYIAVLTHA